MDSKAAADYLLQGAKLLEDKLHPHGFRFALTYADRGSGGYFAEGAYTRGEQQLLLWVRASGQNLAASYRVGNSKWDHADYMRALGLSAVARFPGFADGDPFGGFRRLLSDLDHCNTFLVGDGMAAAEIVRANPRPKGLNALP